MDGFNRKSVLIHLFLLCANLSTYSQVNKCAGVITGLRGNVQVSRSDDSETGQVSWGTQLFAGDKITTGKESEASITLPDNSIIKLGPGGNLTFSDKNIAADNVSHDSRKISSASIINLSDLAPPEEKMQPKGALAGMRSFEYSNIIKSGSPNNTLIRSVKPDFSWIYTGLPDFFNISIYENQELIWKKKATGTYLMYPDDEKELTLGKVYSWKVEAADGEEKVISENYNFTIIPDTELREITRLENEIKLSLQEDNESSSMHSALGAFYRSRGLILESIREFEIVASMNPESPMIFELLGTLYSLSGDFDKSNQEYKKAFALSGKQ